MPSRPMRQVHDALTGDAIIGLTRQDRRRCRCELKAASVGNLIQINTASSNFHKLRWYRAVCRTDCSGYEARTPRHTGLFWQTIWHAAEYPEHGDASVWIAGANERHGSGVTEHLPIPFGSLYGRPLWPTLSRQHEFRDLGHGGFSSYRVCFVKRADLSSHETNGDNNAQSKYDNRADTHQPRVGRCRT
jgi:hypothetical protein